MFVVLLVAYGDWARHVNSYWTDHQDRVMFVTYEQLSQVLC